MRAALSFVALAAGMFGTAADARLTRVDAEAPKPVAAKDGTPAFETVAGVFHGELDPQDPANRIITDIAKAPRNTRGMVEYSANFSIVRPVDLAKRSGVLYYQVPNRGNPVAQSPDADGHILVASGWQGDILPAAGNYWAKVPAATGVTGTILARMVNSPAGAKSLPINGGMTRMSPRPHPVTLDTKRARLVIERRGKADAVLNAADWAFADCDAVPFPGTPDPAKICAKTGFEPDAAYRLTYTAKDPPVLGIGWAATRDLISFLRSGKADDVGTANPAGDAIRWTVGVGDSQSGNYLRSFVHLGFNADERGGQVFDGINPSIAARQIVLNLRFGSPSGAAGAYEPGSEGTLWWGGYNDRARKQGTSSFLDRCGKSATCPKIIETLGSAEFWGLRASPGFVGTDGKGDIALPANVRRYYFPGITHGGSFRGGFPLQGEAHFMGATCLLPGNPNPSREQMRVARKALIAWVKDGTEPPTSRYPMLAAGDLVEPTAEALGWPSIPGAPSPDGHINQFSNYDFGGSLNRRDLSGILNRQPPRLFGILPQLVPRVNADGNETSGVPSVHLQVPLGTYTGWNVETKGYHGGENCGFAGGFIPFARSKVKRDAMSDPRLSLEERYGDHDGFVAKVREAVAHELAAGWLLPDDAARIIKEAQDSAVLR